MSELLPFYNEIRLLMGTVARVTVWSTHAAAQHACEAAFAEFEAVDRAMSRFRDSELTQLLATGRGQLSPALNEVVTRALSIAGDSGGAFDPTLTRGGAARLNHDAENRWLDLHGLTLDLGGIAKGYACDRAALAMKRAGVTVGVIDLGQSSIVAWGDLPVRLALRDPQRLDSEGYGVLLCEGTCFIGSSAQDQQPGHIVTRNTDAVLAVTVLARDAMEADALATAVFAAGVQAGSEILRRRGAKGVVLYRDAQAQRCAAVSAALLPTFYAESDVTISAQ